jgi:GGDEF domain-containing protein
MSSTFTFPFASTPAPHSARNSTVPPPLFRAVATWLGLAREQQRVRPARPAKPRSWEQYKQAMLGAGDKMLARSRSENQPLSVAVFDLNDLPELESVFGAAITRKVVTQVALRLQGMASTKGLVIRTEATVFTVLMPGFGRDRAHQAIERTMGSPCCIELDADEHEIVLVPDFKVHTFRPDSAPLAQVYADLRRDISAAQQVERRRQRYLQRERESHTRPMELQAQGERKPTLAPHPVFRQMDPTIPMPLKH